jgi:hypothetical protein
MLEPAHDLRLSNRKESATRVLNSWYKQFIIIIISSSSSSSSIIKSRQVNEYAKCKLDRFSFSSVA